MRGYWWILFLFLVCFVFYFEGFDGFDGDVFGIFGNDTDFVNVLLLFCNDVYVVVWGWMIPLGSDVVFDY